MTGRRPAGAAPGRELGPARCHVSDLTAEEVPALGWSGGPSHLIAITRTIAAGDYLALRDPSGVPVSVGGIDWRTHPRCGHIHQLATHPRLRGQGLGSALIAALEDRIRSRGCRWATLGVEDDNPRARALYERLGYVRFRHGTESWRVTDADGSERLHVAQVTYLRRVTDRPAPGRDGDGAATALG